MNYIDLIDYRQGVIEISDYIMDLRKIVGNRPILQVGASVIVEDKEGRILLQLRKDNECWGYAGGSVNLDEVVEEAAKRELFEETGLVAKSLELFGVFSGPQIHYIYPNGDEVSNVDIVYICKEYEGVMKAQESEVLKLRFFEASSLPENLSPPIADAIRKWAKGKLSKRDDKMIKNIAIVSLSSGIIGEDFVSHEVELGEKRLLEYGLNVRFMPHSKKGLDFVKNNPEKRAEDLLSAFRDDSIDMILCAIGGDDTYKLLPYLFENEELKNAAQQKIFLGFSDTTFNHFMLHKLGIKTYYGQSFLADICEMDREMLPYSRAFFEELITTGTVKEITPSKVWYEERTDFSPKALNTPRVSHENDGFKLLQGEKHFKGEILGGCLDSIFDMFDAEGHSDSVSLCETYSLFPSLEDWKGKILLLETSEEQPTPEKYRKMLETLKATGVFDVIIGILLGKPMDELYMEEYNKIIVDVVNNPNLPIVTNINIGHATPRCIIPFGVTATVDAEDQIITFE